jgi:uncharacterized protein (DUF362 family)
VVLVQSFDDTSPETFLDVKRLASWRALVIRPTLSESGPIGYASATSARVVTEVLRWLTRDCQAPIAARIAFAGNQSPKCALPALGYMSALDDRCSLVDLSEGPLFRVATPRLPVPVRLPGQFFADQVTVVVAELATHPAERMVGCLAALVAGLPDAARPDLEPMRPELAALVTRLCPPALCVLDAREVRCWDENGALEMVSTGQILIGADPLAVDAAGARLLGLDPAQVPLIAGVRRGLGRRWQNVNHVSPVMAKRPVSAGFLATRLRHRLARAACGLDRLGGRMLDAIRLPELVRVVRRARSRS